MWHKAELMGRPMRLELTRVCLLVSLANRYTTRDALQDRVIVNKKEYLPNSGLCRSGEHRVKLKERDHARELLKIWNVKVIMIPSVITSLDRVTEELAQELEDLGIRRHVETIQSTTLLRSARIKEESWRLDETC